MSSTTWHPLGTRTTYTRPKPGDAIAYAHGVWHVTATHTLGLNDTDRETWLNAGMPDLETWPRTPYRLNLTHAGVTAPDGADPDQPPRGTLDIRAGHSVTWHVYPNGRAAMLLLRRTHAMPRRTPRPGNQPQHGRHRQALPQTGRQPPVPRSA